MRLDPVDSGFRTDRTYGAGPRLFGGLIAAQALAAAASTVAPDRLPQSLHAYFIKGGRVGVDVEFVVERTRDGRSFDTRRVTAGQQGVPIFEMLASFHRPEPTPEWQPAQSISLPMTAADRSVPIPEAWADHFDIRTATSDEEDWPVQPFWFTSRDAVEDDAVLRACALTMISDIGLVSSARPPNLPPRPGPGGAASLDHAIWFHRPFDPARWHFYEAAAVSYGDARGLVRGAVVDEDGTLVATVMQEAMWRP